MSAPMSDAEMRAHIGKLRDIHRVDPLADALVSANMNGDKPVLKGWQNGKPNIVDYRKLSCGAAEHPLIRAAVDAVRAEKYTVAELTWYAENVSLDFSHSNLTGRDPLPYRVDGYKLNVYPLSEREDRQLYGKSAELATSQPGPSVVLADPKVPFVAPDLPLRFTDGGEIAPSAVLFPVLPGYTTSRVAKLAMHHFASQCHWCDSAHTEPNWGLLYSAGATVYVFPTCWGCKDGLESFFAEFTSTLDFVSNDGEEHAIGWPVDEDWQDGLERLNPTQ